MKANILYQLSQLSDENDINNFKKSIIEEKNNTLFEKSDYLFYPIFYKQEIKNINKIVSYLKHNQVVRVGHVCKYCKQNNTIDQEQRRGGGDEYIPTKIQCFNPACGKQYLL